MRRLFPPTLLWEGKIEKGNEVYLTFDDGPHPAITPFVLDALKQYEMHASFFCIGNNAAGHPVIIQRLKSEGHVVGNHTFNHANALKTSIEDYTDDIAKAIPYTSESLFRPPYGRITNRHVGATAKQFPKLQHVMWNVLSGDFDVKRTGESCFNSVRRHTRPGSIIVFHDSQKAWPRLEVALPLTLQWLKDRGLQSVTLT